MEARCSNHPWSTSPEWGQKMEMAKAVSDSQMGGTIGKSTNPWSKYVYCSVSKAVRYRTEGKQKLVKRPMAQVAPTTHGQQVWSEVKK